MGMSPYCSDKLSHGKMLELGQVGTVLLEHLVDHLFDLGQRQYRGRQRVVGDGLKDKARVSGESCLHRHLLDG